MILDAWKASLPVGLRPCLEAISLFQGGYISSRSFYPDFVYHYVPCDRMVHLKPP